MSRSPSPSASEASAALGLGASAASPSEASAALGLGASAASPSGARAVSGSRASAASPIVIVSGLPRSGTSLMMQMLAAGGLPPLSDGARAPDAGNPSGYLEWEPAKALARDPGAIGAARGRAVKVISALLPALPREHRYRVVFMQRDASEIEASQRALLASHGVPEPDGVSADALARHVARTRSWLAAQPEFATCPVVFRDAIERPHETAARVCVFLGLELDVARMAAAVDASLYRQRRESLSSRRRS